MGLRGTYWGVEGDYKGYRRVGEERGGGGMSRGGMIWVWGNLGVLG